MEPIVPCIFEHEEDGNLVSHGLPGREGYTCGHAEELGGRVEEPDLRELDGEMRQED